MNKRKYLLNVKCPRCGQWMLLSPVDDYPLYCPNCEEDFYSIEVYNEICGDWFEVSVIMSFDEYKAMLESIKENFKDACFIGYDDMGVCDIGFETIPSCERVKDIIKFFNLVEE